MQVTDDPADLAVIAPSMLSGAKVVKYLPLSVPTQIAACVPSENDHPQKRWAFILNLVAVCWKRWSREYLTRFRHVVSGAGKAKIYELETWC